MVLDSDDFEDLPEDFGAILEDSELEVEDDEEQDEPTLTFKVDHGRIRSKTDGHEAMVQAVDKILKTERNIYAIYDDQYGNDLLDLIGQDMDYAEAEVERMITEALEEDDRVIGVEITEITPVRVDEPPEDIHRDTLKVTGTCYTVYGDIPIDEEVVLNES